MTLTRRVGYGCQISVDGSGSTNFTVLGAVVDGFKKSGVKIDFAETTILSEFWKTFQQAGGDAGEFSFSIAYDPLDVSTTQTLTGLLNNVNACDANWQISFPAVGCGSGSGLTATAETFKGHLSGFEVEGMKEKMIVASITVKVTGSPGYTGV